MRTNFVRRRVLRLVTPVTVVAVLGTAALAARQQPSRDAAVARTLSGTATISGTVVADEPNGQPLRRVTLTLSSPTTSGPSIQRSTTTDDTGRFVFSRLPAGNYSTLRAARAGWVPVVYGEKRVGGIGTPITVQDGQPITVALKMMRGAVITGMIADQSGKPAAQANVEAIAIRVVNGVRTPGPRFGMSSTSTDDRGVYRIYGLAPGDYIVAVSPRFMSSGETRPITDEEMRWAQQQMRPSGTVVAAPAPAPKPAQAVTYSPVYFPGTTDAATAGLVTITAGQERSGVSFSMQLVPTARLEGTVVDQDGQTPASTEVRILPRSAASETTMTSMFMMETMIMSSRSATTDGKFSLQGIRPGEYTLTARAAPRGSGAAPSAAPSGRGGPAMPMTLWATADVTVDGNDQTGIELRVQPGMTLTGRVVFESETRPPPTDMSTVQVRLSAAPSPTGVTVSVGAAAAQFAAGTNQFSLSGVTPGRYFVNGFLPPPAPGVTWVVRSATVNGVNAADVPIEIKPQQDIDDVVVTFTDKTAEVSGTLVDGAGKPTPEFSIILFPADRTMWIQRGRRLRPPVRASTQGKFRFANLLPGDYYMAALTDFEPNDYSNPTFLEQVVAAGALKISVAEGEKKVQDLKIAGG